MQKHARFRRVALVVFGLATVFASALMAHDFWMVPIQLEFGEENSITVHGQTSVRFATSESAVGATRVAEAILHDGKNGHPITDLGVAEKSLRLTHAPRAKGQYTVGVRLQPASTRSAPAAFKRYLELEGAPELAARYEQQGLMPKDTITRKSIKYAKTYVQVGRGGPRSFAQRLGHPLELSVAKDPSALRNGETAEIVLEFLGKPLADATLTAGWVPFNDLTALNGGAGPAGDVKVTTDARGVAKLPVGNAGWWNIRTIHALPSSAQGEWDVHWATLVFPVQAR
ncbi:MAG: DUF4198 domain-containing protein [Gemmatimonadota bacterium]